MTRTELLMEIERLRKEMNELAVDAATKNKLLELSKHIDKIIIQYHKTAV